jgi:hypothetical protein
MRSILVLGLLIILGVSAADAATANYPRTSHQYQHTSHGYGTSHHNRFGGHHYGTGHHAHGGQPT